MRFSLSTRARTAASIGALSGFFFSTISCLTTPPPLAAKTGSSTSSSPDTTASSVSCTDTFFPGGHLPEDLDRLAHTCGPGMHPLTPLHEAAQHEADAVDRYDFSAMEAGKCYRIYAVGDAGVASIDLTVRDASGRVLAGGEHNSAEANARPTRFALLPPTTPLCIAQPGDLTLEVGIGRGAGHYVVQVWQN